MLKNRGNEMFRTRKEVTTKEGAIRSALSIYNFLVRHLTPPEECGKCYRSIWPHRRRIYSPVHAPFTLKTFIDEEGRETNFVSRETFYCVHHPSSDAEVDKIIKKLSTSIGD